MADQKLVKIMKKLVFCLFTLCVLFCSKSCTFLTQKSFDYYAILDSNDKGKLIISDGTLESGEDVWFIKTQKTLVAVVKNSPFSIFNGMYAGYCGGLDGQNLKRCIVETSIPMETLSKDGIPPNALVRTTISVYNGYDIFHDWVIY